MQTFHENEMGRKDSKNKSSQTSATASNSSPCSSQTTNTSSSKHGQEEEKIQYPLIEIDKDSKV